MEKIAILILAHKSILQVGRFVDQFQDDLFDIYIHFDKKFEFSSGELKLLNKRNVVILPDSQRILTNWGDITLVLATIQLLKASAKNNYFFYVLCSGQDLLIKRSTDLYQTLSENRNANFNTLMPSSKLFNKRNQVPYFQCMRASKGSAYFLRNIWKYLTGGRKHTFPFLISRFYKEHTFRFGYQWFAYNREAVTYILDYLHSHPEFLNFFKNKLVPDECFFQTLLWTNPKFKDSFLPGITYAVFPPKKSSSPKVFTEADFGELMSCGKFIARKFDIDVDQNIIEKVIMATKP